MDIGIAALGGKTFNKVYRDNNERIIFEGDESFIMLHRDDCCESVTIDDINGDLNDLVGAPILKAEESSNSDNPPEGTRPESFTWTFYHLATRKGYVTIRWYGESNGYYSESVSMERYKL